MISSSKRQKALSVLQSVEVGDVWKCDDDLYVVISRDEEDQVWALAWFGTRTTRDPRTDGEVVLLCRGQVRGSWWELVSRG